MEISRKWRFSCLLLGLLFLTTTLLGVQGEVELEGPSESECRPYIEKALKELETADIEHADPRTPTEDIPVPEEIIDDSEHNVSAGEDDTEVIEPSELEEGEDILDDSAENPTEQISETDEEVSTEIDKSKEDAINEATEINEVSSEVDASVEQADEPPETEGQSEEEQDDQTISSEKTEKSSEVDEHQDESAEEDKIDSDASAEQHEYDDSTPTAEINEIKESIEDQTTDSLEEPVDVEQSVEVEEQGGKDSAEKIESEDLEVKREETSSAEDDIEQATNLSTESTENVESKEESSTEQLQPSSEVEELQEHVEDSDTLIEESDKSKEEVENVIEDSDKSKESYENEVEGSGKSAEELNKSIEESEKSEEEHEEVEKVEGSQEASEEIVETPEESQKSEEEAEPSVMIEDSTKLTGENVKSDEETDTRSGEIGVDDKSIEELAEVVEINKEDAESVSGEEISKEEVEIEEEEKSESKESVPEEELILEIEVPENLRPTDHIDQLLKLHDSETENTINRISEVTLRDLKKLYENAIKPLETLYKYRDLSNRHFGDSEIFSKPLVLFMGPWSGGKSSIINYLLDNEYNTTSLRTGAEPSPAYFNLLMHGEQPEVLDGTQLAADFTFAGLQKFGQGLEERLRGLKLPSKLLEKINIVEIPGILEVRKQVSRIFPFNDACQWFIDRADIIFLVYDPSKLDVGPETEAILDQLKGREHQTRIVLNKADQVKPEELMRVQSALIWNISPLMSSAQPPVMYTTSLWSRPYETWAPVRLLQAQERAFLRDLRSAVDKRIENKISSARRFAVRVRNHAKMVDCYLTTYYNHKSVFGNRKQVSDQIIEHPQDYHIYEGLSTLTNISRYDLPDPDVYRDFFRLNPLYDFQQLSATCTYFRGCPINKLDVAIAYDLPEMVGKHKKMVESALAELKTES